MLPLLKKSIPCCPHTSKSTYIFVKNYFGLVLLVNSAWSVHISLLIQMREINIMDSKFIFMWKKLFVVFYKHSSSLHKTLIFTTGVDFLWIIVRFLSAVWTLILTAPIHCRGSSLQICYDKKTTSVHFHFRVNYSFNLLRFKKAQKHFI